MNAQKEALVSKRPWKASILWTPSVITHFKAFIRGMPEPLQWKAEPRVSTAYETNLLKVGWKQKWAIATARDKQTFPWAQPHYHSSHSPYLSEAPGPHITEAPAHPCPLLRHSQQLLQDHPRYPAAEERWREVCMCTQWNVANQKGQ